MPTTRISRADRGTGVLLMKIPKEQPPITNNCQYDDPRPIGESKVEDLDAVAQPLPEDAEVASPRVSEDEKS